MRLSEAFANYALDIIAFRNQSRKTEEAHNVALKSLIRFTGDINVSELTFDIVREWKLSMEKRELGSETVRGYLIKLRVVLNYLRFKGVECLDPSNIPLPKRNPKLPEFLSPLEVTKLINATAKTRNKAIISMLYSTGLRVNELCQLDRSDVKNDFFTIVGKGGSKQLCFIDERSRGFLRSYLRTRRDNSPALFLSPQKASRITPGTVQEIFKYARVKAGFDWPVHPHSMRHSFATNLMVNGAPIYSVSKLLGHKRLDTTAQYLHLYDSHLEEIHKRYHST